MTSSPEYVVCVECETPCYVFEWEEGRLRDALCQACGNDDPERFATQEEFDALTGG
jgi:translation initiation factor 2 beta subunit (eIF-2beta)/eIF-5